MAPRSARDEFLSKLEEVAHEHAALSNPLRLAIIAIVVLKKEASWSELKEALEKLFGPVNPNALLFHLNRLAEAGYVTRAGAGKKTRYVARTVPVEVVELLGSLRAALQEPSP